MGLGYIHSVDVIRDGFPKLFLFSLFPESLSKLQEGPCLWHLSLFFYNVEPRYSGTHAQLNSYLPVINAASSMSSFPRHNLPFLPRALCQPLPPSLSARDICALSLASALPS